MLRTKALAVILIIISVSFLIYGCKAEPETDPEPQPLTIKSEYNYNDCKITVHRKDGSIVYQTRGTVIEHHGTDHEIDVYTEADD